MNITPISQRDPRWGNERIGNSFATVYDYGCTITALSMCLEKLRGYFCNPKNAARYWKFNSRGEILWKQTKFHGMNFIERLYTANIKRLSDYANEPTKAAIAEVNHGAHWIYIVEVRGSRISIVDPIDGQYYEDIPRHKYKITGGAVFEQNNIAPEWMESAIQNFKDRGVDLTLPLQELDIEEIEKVFHDLGIINKLEGKITLGRLLVIIEKIKEWY